MKLLSVFATIIPLAALLLTVPSCLYAQNTFLTDSLQRALKQAASDTARVSALCRLSEVLVVVESKDSLARAAANEALRLAKRLGASNYAPFAAEYRALALQAMGVTCRFVGDEPSRPLGEPYFRQALEEIQTIPNQERSLEMQASVLQSWFLELRFRKQIHRKDDKPREELRREAEQILQRQEAIAEKLRNNALRGRTVLNRAIVLTDTLAQQLLLCLRSVQLYEQSSDAQGLTSALQYVGYYAQAMGDYPRAIQAFVRAARLYDSARIFNAGLAVCHQSLGDIYLTLADTAKALESYERAEPYSERYDVRFNRLGLLSQIGEINRALGRSDKARRYFERALTLSNTRTEIHDVVYSARLYRLLERYAEALTTLGKARHQMENLSPQVVSFEILLELTLTFQEQARKNHAAQTQQESRLQQYYAILDSALFYCRQCLPILSDERYDVGSAERFLKIYTLLYELSKERGDAQNALVYHERRERWRDKTLSSETYRVIAAMESRAVVEAIEAKVETLETQERLQRAMIVFVSVVALGFVVIAGLLAWRFRERKKLAEILHRQAETLRQQNGRLEAMNQEKNELMSIVAHDLKNPISAVRGFAEILQTESELEPSVGTIVRHIHNTAERMFELVKNLLDINRLESGLADIHLVDVDIFPIAKAVAEQYAHRAREKNITVQFVSEILSGVAKIDERSFMQVLDNIISNAVKYSPHGKNVFIRLKASSEAVRVEIQDEGPGISEEDMKKLFGKFTRLSARPTGGEHSTGLGLSIVKKMVEAMDGRVWCESELGRGATFIVELPKAP